jgi:hypothetical protein
VFFSRGHLKKNSTHGLQWADFQGFAPSGPLAECTVANRKRFAKPLKIRPRALNAIDVLLKRMAVTGYSRYLYPFMIFLASSAQSARRVVNKGPRVQGFKDYILFLILSLEPLTPRILES